MSDKIMINGQEVSEIRILRSDDPDPETNGFSPEDEVRAEVIFISANGDSLVVHTQPLHTLLTEAT